MSEKYLYHADYSVFIVFFLNSFHEEKKKHANMNIYHKVCMLIAPVI